MRSLLLSLTCLLTLSGITVSGDEPEKSTPQDLVRQQLSEYLTAFNDEDSKKIASLWSENSVFTNLSTGEKTEGREQIISDLKQFFADNENALLTAETSSFKQLGESVIQVTGNTRLQLDDGTVESTNFEVLFTKENKIWKIASITESAQVAASAKDSLKQLDWLVGTWQDDSDQVIATTSCKWSATQVFLLRTFVIETEDGTSQGTEVIGWDPQFQQIRSWSFFSDGTFGSGFWSKNGDSWVIKSVHTLSSGQLAESIRVLSDITEDSLQVTLKSSSIDGELQPSREPVTVRRVPEATTKTVEGGQE